MTSISCKRLGVYKRIGLVSDSMTKHICHPHTCIIMITCKKKKRVFVVNRRINKTQQNLHVTKRIRYEYSYLLCMRFKKTCSEN